MTSNILLKFLTTKQNVPPFPIIMFVTNIHQTHKVIIVFISSYPVAELRLNIEVGRDIFFHIYTR
jgi:hypothetical protein